MEKGETKEKEVKEKDALKIFKLLEITVPDGTIRDSYIAVFPIFLELLYTDNMSASPEFNMSDVIWSAIIFPNGIDKNNPSFVDVSHFMNAILPCHHCGIKPTIALGLVRFYIESTPQ